MYALQIVFKKSVCFRYWIYLTPRRRIFATLSNIHNICKTINSHDKILNYVAL